MSEHNTYEYYREREIIARTCATRATDPRVVKLHMELADQYGKVARGEETIARLLYLREPEYIVSEDFDPKSS